MSSSLACYTGVLVDYLIPSDRKVTEASSLQDSFLAVGLQARTVALPPQSSVLFGLLHTYRLPASPPPFGWSGQELPFRPGEVSPRPVRGRSACSPSEVGSPTCAPPEGWSLLLRVPPGSEKRAQANLGLCWDLSSPPLQSFIGPRKLSLPGSPSGVRSLSGCLDSPPGTSPRPLGSLPPSTRTRPVGGWVQEF